MSNSNSVPHQTSWFHVSNKHTYTHAEVSTGVEAFTDENGNGWVNFFDAYHLFRLDQFNIEGIFDGIPDDEKDCISDTVLVSVRGSARMMLLSVDPVAKESAINMVLECAERRIEDDKEYQRYAATMNRIMDNRQHNYDQNNARAGFVYLVKGGPKSYKIGCSKDAEKRIKSFGIKLPFVIELIHVIPCKDRYASESMLHGRYANKRINGEWFALSNDDIDEIKGITEL